jgi:hypothetical protein
MNLKAENKHVNDSSETKYDTGFQCPSASSFVDDNKRMSRNIFPIHVDDLYSNWLEGVR